MDKYRPLEVEAEFWKGLLPMSKILIEAGINWHIAEDRLPPALYVEEVIKNVDLKDMRFSGGTCPLSIHRIDLKRFLHGISTFKRHSAYCKRVLACAEARGLQLMLIEDDAYLFMRQEMDAKPDQPPPSEPTAA